MLSECLLCITIDHIFEIINDHHCVSSIATHGQRKDRWQRVMQNVYYATDVAVDVILSHWQSDNTVLKLHKE